MIIVLSMLYLVVANFYFLVILLKTTDQSYWYKLELLQ